MTVDLLLDYCTMNFSSGSFTPYSANKLLFGDINSFSPVNYKPDCSVFKSDFGVCFKSDNGNKVTDKTQSFLFGGKGTDIFCDKLPVIYKAFSPTVSRCDFAFDVLMSVEGWRSFVTSVFDRSINDNRARYAFRLITSHDMLACTVNIGSRRGKYFFRIYNKTLESHLPFDGVNFLIRFELEVKYERKIIRDSINIFRVEPFFESYYSHFEFVSKSVLDGWKMALDGFDLPFSFDDIVFSRPTKIKILLDSDSSLSPVSHDSLTVYFAQYESPAAFVADRHGSSVIKVLLCPELLSRAESRFFEKTGLRIHLDVNYWLDDDEYCFDDDSFEFPYFQLSI